MRYISIDKAERDMVLARSVYDSTGRVLLCGNTRLTWEYIEKLAERGMPGIYIDDELTKDIEINESITEELRNQGVRALREGNVDAAMEVGKEIVSQLIHNPKVSLDLIDLRSYDDYTFRHSVNVAVISTIIGMNMKLNVIRLKELSVAAILHDIGKEKIPSEIINKPGKLTPEEYEEVKNHSQYAYEILKHRIDISARVKKGILSHHENEDGSGYPNGLKSGEIYLYAKIIHVADVFDALTSERPYKKAFARAEAVEYLMGSCGRMFDKKVVKAFMKSVSIYAIGTTVKLSDGKEAIVVGNTDNLLRPQLRLMDGTEIDLSSLSEYRNLTILPAEKVVVS